MLQIDSLMLNLSEKNVGFPIVRPENSILFWFLTPKVRGKGAI